LKEDEQPGWWRNSRGEYYVALQMVLMFLVFVGPRFGAGVWQAPWSRITAAAGGLIAGVGLVLCIAGMLRLGRRNLSPFPHPKHGAGLVEDGVYAVVRHPIYGGLSLAALGWALAWRSPVTLGLSILLFLFFDIKSRREEQWPAGLLNDAPRRAHGQGTSVAHSQSVPDLRYSRRS
jgi:protein-S-isoprenylcysteine O-methyltransferase Ste14